MKTMTTIQAAGLLALALVCTATAQCPQSREPGDRPEGMRPPPPPPEEMAANMLAEFDIDGDAKLDELELKEAIVARHQPPDPLEIADRWVEEFDADGNGSLSPEELADALETHRPDKSRGGPHGSRQERNGDRQDG